MGAPENLQRRLRAALDEMKTDPRRNRPGFDCKKLAGKDSWSVRIGSWRIIYDIDDVVRVVAVTKVGPRSSVYG